MTMKKIEDAAKFLHDSGLLFEINRAVLHPRGLALRVTVNDDENDTKFGVIYDYRDGSIVFGEQLFNEGEKKLNRYMDEHPKVYAPQTNPDGSGVGGKK